MRAPVRTRPPVFVASGFVAKYPTGGGNFWVPLQYVLGLRALGVEAYWLELLWPQGDVERARRFVPPFRAFVEEAGVAEHTAVILFPENERDDAPGREERTGGPPDLWERARDGVLLNLAHSVPAPLRDRFARRVLFDVDPGQFQLWARQFELGVGCHDAYLTIGQNLGAPDCPVPLDGVPWHRVWPAVHLPAWPVQPGPGRAWTTVTQWWSEGWTILGDEVIEGHKRTSFLRVVDLPRRVPGAALELAANIHHEETADLELLRSHGWAVVDPAAVAASSAARSLHTSACVPGGSATAPSATSRAGGRASWRRQERRGTCRRAPASASSRRRRRPPPRSRRSRRTMPPRRAPRARSPRTSSPRRSYSRACCRRPAPVERAALRRDYVLLRIAPRVLAW